MGRRYFRESKGSGGSRMIEVEELTMDGRTVRRLIPENDADRKELARRAKAGKLEMGGSFADDEDPDAIDDLLGFE